MNLGYESVITNKYLKPSSVIGEIGPTISIWIRCPGLLGWKSELRSVSDEWRTLPIIHGGHSLRNDLVSKFRPKTASLLFNPKCGRVKMIKFLVSVIDVDRYGNFWGRFFRNLDRVLYWASCFSPARMTLEGCRPWQMYTPFFVKRVSRFWSASLLIERRFWVMSVQTRTPVKGIGAWSIEPVADEKTLWPDATWMGRVGSIWGIIIFYAGTFSLKASWPVTSTWI